MTRAKRSVFLVRQGAAEKVPVLFHQRSLLQKSEHSVIYEAGMADFRIGLSLPIPK
jgi:hypothetical protein